ncbi:MAG TPA: hypothetical protein VFS51_02965 [Gemmatimonadales bacterium]|nr:hypothetical protein [Gemmatimonadales bacterium]
MRQLPPALLLALTACSPGPSPAVGGNKSDTVWVIVHHVAPGKRQAYEDWMTNVWYRTAGEVGQDDADFREALLARRRLTPTRAEQDSSWTYVFLYDRPPVLKTGGTGLGAVFKAAGWPEERIASEVRKMDSVIIRTEAGAMVQQEYSTAK